MVETFMRETRAAFHPPTFVRLTTEPRGVLRPSEYADGRITLCENGSGQITGLSQPVWEFSVSGYRVLPRWLDGRLGLPVDRALVQEFRDICGRTAELLALFAEADNVLDATLDESLSREALGFGPEEQDGNGR
jgi:hypothetical protein